MNGYRNVDSAGEQAMVFRVKDDFHLITRDQIDYKLPESTKIGSGKRNDLVTFLSPMNVDVFEKVLLLCGIDKRCTVFKMLFFHEFCALFCGQNHLRFTAVSLIGNQTEDFGDFFCFHPQLADRPRAEHILVCIAFLHFKKGWATTTVTSHVSALAYQFKTSFDHETHGWASLFTFLLSTIAHSFASRALLPTLFGSSEGTRYAEGMLSSFLSYKHLGAGTLG